MSFPVWFTPGPLSSATCRKALLTFLAAGRLDNRAAEMEQTLEWCRVSPAMTSPGGTLASGTWRHHTIRAAAAGDREAFARLYLDYFGMVHAILLGRVPRREVDDLVQEVFLAAFTRLKSLRDPAAFGGWLATIARNRATDYLRQVHEALELPDELPGGTPIEAETLAALDAIRRLPDAYRETLLMRLVEGMSGDEIAERTGLTPGSVRVNLHRGMAMLREKLGVTLRPSRAPAGVGQETRTEYDT
jgi:RNA polymerase sigma-70 factor, ECF subfamily